MLYSKYFITCLSSFRYLLTGCPSRLDHEASLLLQCVLGARNIYDKDQNAECIGKSLV